MYSTLTYQVYFFFFNDTATTEIYTLSLHDALPIWAARRAASRCRGSTRPHPPPGGSPRCARALRRGAPGPLACSRRSEEHTSELQSLAYLVCRLLLEKKKIKRII